MIINRIIEFLKTCPLIESNSPLSADYLGDEIGTYSVDGTASETIKTNFIDGSSERELIFDFTSREQVEDYTNEDNIIFYEKLANWIEEESEKGNLPVLDSPFKATKLETITHGYVEQMSADKAIYVIQMKLTYYKRRM